MLHFLDCIVTSLIDKCERKKLYFFYFSLVCDKPFEGADGNLQRLFEKNNKRLAELQHNLSLPPEVQR